MDPVLDGSVAKVKDAVKSDWLKVVRAEERSNFLRELIREGLGTNDVENFVMGQGGLRVSVGSKGGARAAEMDRDNVVSLMKTKLNWRIASWMRGRGGGRGIKPGLDWRD